MKPFFLIFKGPPSDSLLKSNDHFDGCTSFPAFVIRSYYCLDCERRFNTNDKANNSCQGKRCSACGRFDCQDYVRGTRPTEYCTRGHCKFYGAYCKRHHVVTKQCQSVKTCLKCRIQYTVVPDRHHKCGHAKCPVCQEWVSIQDHKCYIQPMVEEEEPEPTEEGGGCMVAPPPPLFVYADFEAMQNTEACLWPIFCVIRRVKKRRSMCWRGRIVPCNFCTIWMTSWMYQTGIKNGRFSRSFTT